MKSIFVRFRTFILYGIFGIFTTAIDFCVFYYLKKIGMTDTDTGYTLANAIAWGAAVLFAFFTNKLWVFGSKTKAPLTVLKEFVIFIGGRIFSGLFEIFLPAPMSHWFGAGISFTAFGKTLALDGQWIAKIVVNIFVILVNYIISRWLFKTKKD